MIHRYIRTTWIRSHELIVLTAISVSNRSQNHGGLRAETDTDDSRGTRTVFYGWVSSRRRLQRSLTQPSTGVRAQGARRRMNNQTILSRMHMRSIYFVVIDMEVLLRRLRTPLPLALQRRRSRRRVQVRYLREVRIVYSAEPGIQPGSHLKTAHLLFNRMDR